MASEKKSTKTSSKNVKSNEEILSDFQSLRNEQRMMANKLSEMEVELNEHKYVSNLCQHLCFTIKDKIIVIVRKIF